MNEELTETQLRRIKAVLTHLKHWWAAPAGADAEQEHLDQALTILVELSRDKER
jgi:hypothetical protein